MLGNLEEQAEIISDTDGFVDDYAKDGLRTLFLGKRVISQEEYDDWNAKFDAAINVTKDREEKLASVYEEIEHSI